jgi:hypothetical protein
MGKMKELFIQLQNQQRGMSDDTDWDAPSSNESIYLDPPPNEINLETGLCMWEINESRVWARTYKDALTIFSLI